MTAEAAVLLISFSISFNEKYLETIKGLSGQFMVIKIIVHRSLSLRYLYFCQIAQLFTFLSICSPLPLSSHPGFSWSDLPWGDFMGHYHFFMVF